jgi:carbonic anhydrase/acetyltransferase-like protein (isoleucine patch superfamily)
MIYKFKGFIPVVHESSFVHPLASVTGIVIIGGCLSVCLTAFGDTNKKTPHQF